MTGEEFKPMVPWYRGWQGKITEKEDKKGWVVQGVLERVGENVKVVELPVGMSTQEFKERLEELKGEEKKGSKKRKREKRIRGYVDNCTEESVEFIIKGIEFGEMTDEEIEVILGLRREMGVNGVKMLNEENRVCEYGSIEEMLKGFYEVRLKYYAKRKEYMMSYLSQEKYRLEKKK